MVGGSRTALGKPDALRRLIGAVLAALVVVMLGLAGEAEACAPGTPMSAKVVTHKMKRAAVLDASAAAKTSLAARQERSSLAMVRHCCGNAQSGGSPCQGGCCSACSAALNVSGLGLFGPHLSRRYAFGVTESLLSSKPAPQFRPPRRTA
jgi:hypothetical protein